MHDEFRVRVQVHRPAELLAALKALQPDRDVAHQLGRLAVTHEADHVYVYADSLSAALAARTVLEQAMAQRDLDGSLAVSRWDAGQQRWEDAQAELASIDETLPAERARKPLEGEERSAHDQLQWEVRITLPTHHQASEFASRLEQEGIPVLQRWRHLLVGAQDEDQARALAERLTGEAPAGSKLEVEGSGLPFWYMLHAPAQPFAFFGGLAQ